MSVRSSAVVVCAFFLVSAGAANGQGLAPLQSKLKDVYGSMLGNALPDIASGEASILEASGKKDKASQMRAAAEKMRQGATLAPDEGTAKAAIKSVSNVANDVSDSTVAQSGQLSDSAKTLFIEGVTKYMSGVVKLKGLQGDASQLSTLAGTAGQGLSMMDAVRARGTMSLAKIVASGVPDVTTKSIEGLQAIKKYAASRNIKIPANLLKDF